MSKQQLRNRRLGKRPMKDLSESAVRRQSVVVLILTFLGAVTLLGSWIAQNQFQAKWLDERTYLEKTQFLIEIGQTSSELWQIQLNQEKMRQPRINDLLMVAAYNFVRSITNLIAWEESRVNGGSGAPIVVKNLSQDLARQLYEKQDLDGLLKLVDIAAATKHKYQTDLDQKYFKLMAESRESAETWNWGFFWCYIVGSILLGARWVLTAFLRWPEKLCLRKSETIEERHEN